MSPLINIDFNTGNKYRVFSHQGNHNTTHGVSVTAQIFDEAEIEFHFWTREDAVRFFDSLSSAAEDAGRTDDDDGSRFISESTTMDWDAFRAKYPKE